ncbi:ChaC-like protein [Choiromyces venosus 120613-1]|uniref:glutathione-specific gamma-glutamylcyclotransferase n=1 Tax=Choiromyces venosus 120613-1 TaxID=1336337 RepID=A0A3N4JFW6_9PEZI|nr:ChaC-like protein [Choiromyces venosus 120613-1]
MAGFVRRFWQSSEDHRGTPEAPGRVVTLIERSYWKTLNDHDDDDDQVWGMAFRIKANKVKEVMRELNIREINGYSIRNGVEVFLSEPGAPRIKALVYIGTPDNPQFVARERVPEVDELARHIFNSRGPSGENRDYLYNLYKSLMGLCPAAHDHHVSRLFHRVVAIEAEDEVKHPGEHETVGPDTADPRSKDEQEEMEG